MTGLGHSNVGPAVPFSRDQVTPEIVRTLTPEWKVARIVAEETGDTIWHPFVTVAFADADMRAAAAVLHGFRDPGGLVQLSASKLFLWHPAIPRSVARVAFGDLRAGAIVTYAHLEDAARVRFFRRLGLQPCALKDGFLSLRRPTGLSI